MPEQGNSEQSSRRPKRRNSHESKSKGAPNGHPAADETKSPANFFNRLGQLSPDEWDRHRVYIYRRWPRISRDDQPHYIGTHRQAIDEEFMKAMYGSGRYLLKLNDAKRTVDNAALEIQDLAHPKLAVDELVDCPENERYYKLWPSAVGHKTSTINDGSDSAIRELTSLLKIALTDRPKNEQDDISRTLVNWALTQKDKEREESSPSLDFHATQLST
jgi:hypothetical protein